MTTPLNFKTVDSVAGIGVQKGLVDSRNQFLNSNDIHYAQVVSLKDPFRSGNIGVRVMGIHEEDITDHPQDVIWAPMIQPFGGGENYGFFSLPPVGSDVLVTFLDGDPKNPVVLGSWQSRKFIIKNVNSVNEIAANLSGFCKVRGRQDLIPNNFGSMPTTPPNITLPPNGLLDQGKSIAISKLSQNAVDLINKFVKGGTYISAVTAVVPPIGSVVPGVPSGIITAFADTVMGKIGEVPGLSDATEAWLYSVDTQFGQSLTTAVDAYGLVASASVTSIYPKLSALTPQANNMLTANANNKQLIDAIKPDALENLSGQPGNIIRGLSTLKQKLYNGGINSSITNTLNSIAQSNPQIGNLINANIDNLIATGLKKPTLLSSALVTFDGILKDIALAEKTMSGEITTNDAVTALQSGSVDYVLSNTNKPASKMVFGPQCPLSWRNQLPGRALEELGENLTHDTKVFEGKEEIGSCYISTDNKDKRNGMYLTPEPLNYTWKSPEGSTIEIDDTGFANEDTNEPKGIDNRGIRLTTKKGAILHLVDEKSYEGILVRDKNNNYIWIDSQTNTIHIYSRNDFIENFDADKNLNCVTQREAMTGDHIAYVEKDKKTTVIGNTNFNCHKNLIENVDGTWSITIHGSANITALQDVNIVAANKVVIGGANETRINAAHIIAEGGRIDWNSGV